MKAFMGIIEEVLRKRPGDLADRLAPWVFLIVGGTIIMLMLYSCASAIQ
jgi:hypothetical protein